MVVQAFDSSTREAEAGESLSSSLAPQQPEKPCVEKRQKQNKKFKVILGNTVQDLSQETTQRNR